MHYRELYKYEYLIKSDCTKLIKGEILGFLFLLFSVGVFWTDIFESDKWAIDLFGINISLYYLYPVTIGICGLFYLSGNFFKYYRYTISDQYRIGHWNGFKKEYFNCIGIANDKKVYLIPVADGKQDELIEVLMNQVDKQVKA